MIVNRTVLSVKSLILHHVMRFGRRSEDRCSGDRVIAMVVTFDGHPEHELYPARVSPDIFFRAHMGKQATVISLIVLATLLAGLGTVYTIDRALMASTTFMKASSE